MAYDGEKATPPSTVEMVTRTIIERERVFSRFYGNDPAAAIEFKEEIKHSLETMTLTDARRRQEFTTTNM